MDYWVIFLSHLVCGTLLWQPWKSETATFNKSSRFNKAQHLFRKIYYFLGTMAKGCVSYLSEAVKKEPEGKLNQVVQPLGEKNSLCSPQ